MKSARNSWADHVPDRLQKELYPGAEIPFVPVEPDVLDGGDVVEGFGVDTLATGCRVRRVVGRSPFRHAQVSQLVPD
jgi:hypothetical protein